MAKIMVVGGFELGEAQGEAIKRLAESIGRQLIERGHDVLTGGQTDLDQVVACSAAATAAELGGAAAERVTNYVLRGSATKFDCGRTLRSELEDWERIAKELRYPEPVINADVMIVLGGWDGTYRAVNWARLAGTPVVPIAGFGHASEEIYRQELGWFEARYADRVDRHEFELLNQVLVDSGVEALAGLAADVIALAEKIVSSKKVFVVMSFSKSMEFEAVYKVFKEVAADAGFECFRVDRKAKGKGERIIPAIIDGIRKSAFVIADVSDAKVNVYYELGLAVGADVPVIVTAREGTEIPFDIFDVPVLFWSTEPEALARQVRERIHDIKTPGIKAADR